MSATGPVFPTLVTEPAAAEASPTGEATRGAAPVPGGITGGGLREAAAALAGAGGGITPFRAAGSFTATFGGLGGGGCHPGGGTTRTMLSHFGQIRICPIADTSKTFSLAWQVVQEIVKSDSSTA
jgi:hypothetical protein